MTARPGYIRPRYVYKLDVIRPPGSDAPGWAPPGWPAVPPGLPLRTRLAAARHARAARSRGFRWPRGRLYISAAAAHYNAWVLESFGAIVTIRKSDPITFSQPGYKLHDPEMEQAGHA